MIVIVGGGPAGLTCARVLHRERAQFLLLERQPALGGRVQTDITAEGYRLDRGFQVLFTRYPAARRHLDLDRLGVRAFAPGAVVVGPDGTLDELDDPLRVPGKAWRTLRSPVLTLADKGRIALELADLRLRTAEGIWTDRDSTTHAYLHDRGFSEQAIEQFFAPFFGAIFLDRSLNTSSNVFRFAFKMLAEGDTVVPALGMGEVSQQLAASLPPAAVRTRTAVDALLRRDGGVIGVLAAGEEIRADAVVVATEAPAAAELTGLPLTAEGLGVTTLYFGGGAPLLAGRKVWLNTAPSGYINEAVQISNVSADYAPPGEHLLSVTVLGTRSGEDDAKLARGVRDELTHWCGADAVAGQRLLSLSRIPYAQFPQPVGFQPALPPQRTATPGLYLAGELTRSSSVNGAIEAGEAAARLVLEDLPHLARGAG